MRIPLKSLTLAAALGIASIAGLSASPAQARDWHGGHRHGYHHSPRSSFSVSFGEWAAPEPIYVPSYNYVPVPPPAPMPAPYIETAYQPADATNGRYCREYNTVSRVAGRMQETYGTACYQPDGSWQIVDTNN